MLMTKALRTNAGCDVDANEDECQTSKEDFVDREEIRWVEYNLKRNHGDDDEDKSWWWWGWGGGGVVRLRIRFTDYKIAPGIKSSLHIEIVNLPYKQTQYGWFFHPGRVWNYTDPVLVFVIESITWVYVMHLLPSCSFALLFRARGQW